MSRDATRVRIIEFIAAEIAQEGYSPRPAEIAANLSINEQTVRYHLMKLLAGGRVRFGVENDYRTIRVVNGEAER